MKRIGTIGAAALLTGAGLTLGMGGCEVIDTYHSEKVEGRRISGRTLSQLANPPRSEESMFELLGPPTRSMAQTDGEVVHVWEFSREKRGGANIAFVIDADERKVEQQTVYVKVRDGYVAEYWADGDYPIDLTIAY
ncbi:MAG: hypothetical protein AAGI17_01430 [Planctomycetota bacterium]